MPAAGERRRWTPAEDDRLDRLVTVGLEYRDIAAILKRSEDACKGRASSRGLKKDRAVVLENRQRGRLRFQLDPERVETRRARLRETFTPEARMLLAAELAERNRRGITGVRHHSEATKQKISEALSGRVYSAEHRRRISEGRKRYWARKRHDSRAEIEATRAAMLADRERGSSLEPPPARERSWCEQCERLVAQGCASQWCKVA